MSPQPNGADTLAHLQGRVRELELALELLGRRWQDELVPRLVAIEQDVDRLLELIEERVQHPEDGADTGT